MVASKVAMLVSPSANEVAWPMSPAALAVMALHSPSSSIKKSAPSARASRSAR